MSLVLVPLTLRVLPVADESPHLTETLAATFARERFVLHVHVPVWKKKKHWMKTHLDGAGGEGGSNT